MTACRFGGNFKLWLHDSKDWLTTRGPRSKLAGTNGLKFLNPVLCPGRTGG